MRPNFLRVLILDLVIWRNLSQWGTITVVGRLMLLRRNLLKRSFNLDLDYHQGMNGHLLYSPPSAFIDLEASSNKILAHVCNRWTGRDVETLVEDIGEKSRFRLSVEGRPS
jgi:hypothetical protein